MGSALLSTLHTEITMTQAQATQSSQAAQASASDAIQLDYPITKGDGTKVASVTLRRASVKDLRRMKEFGADQVDQELGLMAKLAGMVPEDFDLIDAADFDKIQASFRRIIGRY
jgi:hypothetical protein